MDKQEKKKLDDEKKRIQEYQYRLRERITKEPVLRCSFVNLESKGVSLDFTYEGLFKYHLEDGRECELPLCVVEHINSLKVPVMKYKIDPTTGMLQPDTEVKQMLQRFSVTPINLKEYTNALKEGQEEK